MRRKGSKLFTDPLPLVYYSKIVRPDEVPVLRPIRSEPRGSGEGWVSMMIYLELRKSGYNRIDAVLQLRKWNDNNYWYIL